LWSPEWPQDVLGAIDEARRAKGETVFKTSCATCHAAIDRKAPGRRVAFKSADVGTDQTVNRNFLRLADTGRLRNRKKTLLGRERFGAQEPVGAILKHVVERSILDPNLNGPAIVAALEKAGLDAAKAAIGRSHLIDSLNPGFRLTGTIDSPERRYSGNFDSLRSEGRSLVVGGGHFLVKEKNPAAGAGAEEVLDLREADAVQAARANSRGLVARGVGPGAESPATATIATATVKLDFKSRPLNGVWATAPYLHNGSVRTLADLLKPAALRAKTFHVGSREFDPECVGFQDDPAFPVFDTTLPGNSNAGHEFGAALAEEERRDLLEYLKSL
ncbi:MAG TPA: di-heme-cytochrome C peroxidase, partial [Planctomycetia bacterium]|nr:di-heme-cytochrome C peroxidase [Planctomycetia bacterium]